MTQGQCPHPWNKTKKGTFNKGHVQVNDGRGCFKKGNKITEELRVKNRTLGKQRYSSGIHPFVAKNILAELFANKEEWYEIGKSKWKKLSKTIMHRDGFKCYNCDSTKYLNVHHVVPYFISKNNSEDNLITLCASCHATIEYFTRLQYMEEKKWTKSTERR